MIVLGHFSPQVQAQNGFAGPELLHNVVAQFYDVPHIRSAFSSILRCDKLTFQRQRPTVRLIPPHTRARPLVLLQRPPSCQRRRTRPHRRCAHLVHDVADLLRLVHSSGPRVLCPRHGQRSRRRGVLIRRTVPSRRCRSAKGHTRPRSRRWRLGRIRPQAPLRRDEGPEYAPERSSERRGEVQRN